MALGGILSPWQFPNVHKGHRECLLPFSRRVGSGVEDGLKPRATAQRIAGSIPVLGTLFVFFVFLL